MAQLARGIRASYAFVERNFNLVKRYWGWELVWLAYSIASTLSITYIGAGMEAISGVAVDTDYLILYLLIGTMVWRFLGIVFDNISEMIAWERWEGTIEYTFMAPITRMTHMLGHTVFSILYSLVFTVVTLGVVALFFRLDLSGANLVGATASLLAGSLSGVTPGTPVGAFILPLNVDPYFFFTVLHPNTPPLFGSAGQLDSTGHAPVRFVLPPNQPAALIGLRLWHAFGVIGTALDLVSNPVPLDFVK